MAPLSGAPAKGKAKRAAKPAKHVSVRAKAKKAKPAVRVRKVRATQRRTAKKLPARSHRARVVQPASRPQAPETAAPSLSTPCFTCSNNLLEVAHSFTGLRYRRGGSTPETGFDCSGFVRYVFQSAQDLLLPRSASQQFTQGMAVAREDLVAGDLVFFRRGGSHWHVGIYNGDGNFIHSPNSRESIKLTSLDTPYYKRHFIGARRISTPAPLLAGNLQVPVLPPPPDFIAADTEEPRPF